MKGYLQYSGAEIGPYLNIAELRIRDQKEYLVKPVTVENRGGDDVPAAFEVSVNAPALDINSSFLASLEWYFRIYFPTENEEIRLHLRSYLPDFNARLERNTYTTHMVKLKFLIQRDDYIYYVTGIDAGEAPAMSALIEDVDQGGTVYV